VVAILHEKNEKIKMGNAAFDRELKTTAMVCLPPERLKERLVSRPHGESCIIIA
jgi:hypothetical protein